MHFLFYMDLLTKMFHYWDYIASDRLDGTLEEISKIAVVDYLYNVQETFWKERKTTRNLNQDSSCSNRNLKGAAAQCKSTVFPLHQPDLRDLLYSGRPNDRDTY
jgi:hypothetical protein